MTYRKHVGTKGYHPDDIDAYENGVPAHRKMLPHDACGISTGGRFDSLNGKRYDGASRKLANMSAQKTAILKRVTYKSCAQSNREPWGERAQSGLGC